jgi:hypothetical protein
MVLAPLQALAAFFMPIQPARANHHPATPLPVLRRSDAQNLHKKAAAPILTAANAPTVSRLKVLREFEPGMGRHQTGRMVICGRMSDVCAELDRIAEKETLRV